MLNLQGPNARDLCRTSPQRTFQIELSLWHHAKNRNWLSKRLGCQNFVYRELGWELYIPTEMTLGIYDRILEEGKILD